MAGRRVAKPRTVEQVGSTSVADPATDRALTELQSALAALQAFSRPQVIDANLIVGDNVVFHSLGRIPAFVQVEPSVSNATFAWSRVVANPHPERQVIVNVIGVAQPNAKVMVF